MTSATLNPFRTGAAGKARLAGLPSGVVLFMLDVLAVLGVWPVLLWAGGAGGTLPAHGGAVLYPAAHLLLLYAMGMYRRDAMVEMRRSLSRLPLVVGMGMALATAVVVAVALATGGPLRWTEPAAAFAVGAINFTAAAAAARLAFRALRQRGVLHRRLLIIGAGTRAWDLLLMLGREGRTLNDTVYCLHDPAHGDIDDRLVADPAVRIVEGISALDAARLARADQIVVAPEERRGMKLETLVACKRAGFPVVEYLGFVEKEIRRVDLKRMELGWLLYSDGFRFSLMDRALKRLFDLTVSTLVLVAMSPFLALAALAIRLEGKGPVLYRQTRVTVDGCHFEILKLRTMRVDAEAQGIVWARAKDDRITAVGRFLRRTRIDELPQLANILTGEMSFVGPRPERPEFVAALARDIPLYHERHMVKAGLTGWAQVNYPYGASVNDARSKLSYDLYYVKNFSILFDFVILLQTLRVVLWPSGVR